MLVINHGVPNTDIYVGVAKQKVKESIQKIQIQLKRFAIGYKYRYKYEIYIDLSNFDNINITTASTTYNTFISFLQNQARVQLGALLFRLPNKMT